MPYRSEQLSPERHRVDDFDSGEPKLDQWLREHAAGADARRVARSFVFVNADRPDAVLGYYALAGHRIAREVLPSKLGRGSPSEVPAVLLARLALDRSAQGSGLGGALLADALGRVIIATEIVAARFVVVDALHDRAAAFYEHYGFTRVPQTLRLVQKVSDIATSITAP